VNAEQQQNILIVSTKPLKQSQQPTIPHQQTPTIHQQQIMIQTQTAAVM
jgi:hypothetical protein